MGIGFVIIIYIFALGIISFAGTLFLAALSWVILWGSPKTTKIIAIHKAPIIPALASIYVFIGYLIYAIACIAIRDVDPGFGDKFRVPLGSGYTLNMIDISEQSFIESPSGENLGYGFKKIGFDDLSVYLELNNKKYMVIDKSNNTYFKNLTFDQLNGKLQSSGITAVHYFTPEEAYNHLRWTAFDFIAAIVIFSLPLFLFLRFLTHVIKLKISYKSIN